MADACSGGRRSLRYEFRRESNGSTAGGLTLGGILSIKETTSYQIQNPTLLDLIRDDPVSGNDSKNTWNLFREKLRLKLAGSACTSTTTGGVLSSHVHITTDNSRTTTGNDTSRLNSPPVSNNGSVPDAQTAIYTNRLNSPPVGHTNSVPDTQTVSDTNRLNSPPVTVSNTGSVPNTQPANVRSEPPEEEHAQPSTEVNRRDGGDGGGTATVKMSLMSLLEVDGSANFEDDDEEMVEEVAEDGGNGGGGGGGYNNCCVCMVRHRGAAFIPCGHTFCRVCSRELFVKRANCPLCNNFILEILDIF